MAEKALFIKGKNLYHKYETEIIKEVLDYMNSMGITIIEYEYDDFSPGNSAYAINDLIEANPDIKYAVGSYVDASIIEYLYANVKKVLICPFHEVSPVVNIYTDKNNVIAGYDAIDKWNNSSHADCGVHQWLDPVINIFPSSSFAEYERRKGSYWEVATKEDYKTKLEKLAHSNIWKTWGLN